MSDPFPPASIVLAKLKGYPPWPSMVIPESRAPEAVLKVKPKESTLKKKKSKTPNEDEKDSLVCVRFLQDDNYMWSLSGDLTPLSKEEIDKYVNSRRNKNNAISKAYFMAQNPPDLEDYIAFGSSGKNTTLVQDPWGSSNKRTKDQPPKQKKMKIVTTPSSDKPRTITISLKTKSAVPPSFQNKYQRANSQSQDIPRAFYTEPGPQDQDWGMDSGDEFSNEQDVPIVDLSTVPTSLELQNHMAKIKPLILEAKLQLQELLLPETASSKPSKYSAKDLQVVENIVTALSQDAKIPLSLIKSMNLHKVLFDALKKPELAQFPSTRAMIGTLVKSWFDLDIQPDETWRFGFKVEVKEETPLVNGANA